MQLSHTFTHIVYLLVSIQFQDTLWEEVKNRPKKQYSSHYPAKYHQWGVGVRVFRFRKSFLPNMSLPHNFGLSLIQTYPDLFLK